AHYWLDRRQVTAAVNEESSISQDKTEVSSAVKAALNDRMKYQLSVASEQSDSALANGGNGETPVTLAESTGEREPDLAQTAIPGAEEPDPVGFKVQAANWFQDVIERLLHPVPLNFESEPWFPLLIGLLLGWLVVAGAKIGLLILRLIQL